VSALFESCFVGEGCAFATIRVGEDGHVVGVDPDEGDDAECIEAALIGLCLPTLVDRGPQEVVACGV
jgi:hypothetical protein